MKLLIETAQMRNVKGFGFFSDVNSAMLTLAPKGKQYFGKGAHGSLLMGEAPIIPISNKDLLKRNFGMINTVLAYK